MPETRHPLDWKLVAFALVACYVVPGIVLAAVLLGAERLLAGDALKLATGVLSLVGFLAPPVGGGYVAARFASRQPWRHVVVVGGLGALLSLIAFFHAAPRSMLLYALASVVLAMFGGFIRLQGRPRG